VQSDAPPAIERLAETRVSTISPPASGKTAAAVKQTPEPVNPGPAKLVRSGATDIAARDDEIERLYCIEQLSANQVDYDLRLSPGTTKRVLVGRGVALRTISEAAKLRHAQNAVRRDGYLASGAPKLKPVEVPKNAPRKVVKLEELRPVERLDAPKRTGREAVKFNKDRTYKIVRQKQAAARREPMTTQDLQDAVKRFFEKGGEITEIKTAPIEQTARPAVGMRDGMKR
jgi:hypothetical protein